MKRVMFFTVIFFFLSSVFAACCLSTSCGCGDTRGYAYKVTGLESSLHEYSGIANDPTPFDNPVLPANPRVAYNAFVFVFAPEIAQIAFKNTPLHSAASFAYACEPSIRPSQEYVSLKVTSPQDYETASGTFAAGNDLSSLFDIHLVSTRQSVTQNDPSAYDSPFFLQLNTAPVSSSIHQFTFTFKLSDESEIIVLSPSIELL